MNKLLILALVATTVICSGQWNEQDLSQVQNDAYVSDLEKLARNKLHNKENSEPKLVKLETQVVAGMNYKFTYENFDRLCHVTIWAKPWENTSEVTSVKCDKPQHQKGFDKEAWEEKKNKDKKKHNYGGWYNINDKGLIGTDELALDLYTKAQQNVAQVYGINEELTKKSIETKIVAGSLYRVTLEDNNNNQYQTYFLSQPWVQNGVYQIVDTQVIKAEQGPKVGGWTEVPAAQNDEFTQEIIAEAKQYIYGVTGYNGIIEYQQMNKKVVNGVVYKVEFKSLDGQKFAVEVLSQPWNEEKKFSVVNFNATKDE